MGSGVSTSRDFFLLPSLEKSSAAATESRPSEDEATVAEVDPAVLAGVAEADFEEILTVSAARFAPDGRCRLLVATPGRFESVV